MTDSDQSVETHGPALDVDQGLAKLKTAELAEQLEQQDAADAAADALEVLDDATALAAGAAELEAELELTEAAQGEDYEPTDSERADWQQDLIDAIEASHKFSDEGRFFSRIANQLVEIRQATRVGQAINQHYPDFLQERRAAGEPELEIEALFDRARAGAGAVFSLINATIRTLEQCDPPGLRGPAQSAVPVPRHAPPPASLRNEARDRRPMAPANRPEPVSEAPGPRGVPSHETEDAAPQIDPVRQKVVAVQRQLEEQRQQQARSGARGGVAPHVGRVAPRPEVTRRKMSGPVGQREIVVPRDPSASVIMAARQLLDDLRRRARTVSRERITRFCHSVERLATEGKVSPKLGRFAGEVQLHQNAKNVAKLASFFLADMKGRGPTGATGPTGPVQNR